MKDADMVSGMLTAIRDFVQDSFRVEGDAGGAGVSDDTMESLKVGDLAVWIETGPHAILAAVIRGTAPRDFRRVLQQTVETIHLEFGEALESFNGDASTLDGSLSILEDCLQTEYRADERKGRSRAAMVLGAAGVVAFLVWGVLALFSYTHLTLPTSDLV